VLRAQTDDGVQSREKTKVDTLQEVIVTEKRRANTVRIAQPLQVVSKEEIAAYGYGGVADAVRRFSGVAVKDYGGIGGLKTVSIRGFDPNHTAVSYDGVVVGNTQAGQVDISRFSLENIGELSLSIGQESDIFQSARMLSAAGVLNLKTEQPDFLSGSKEALRAKIATASFGIVNPSLRYARKLGKRSAFWVDATYLRADGTYPFRLKNGNITTKEKRYNSDVESYFSEANYLYQRNDSNDFRLKVYYFNSERGLPGNVILYNSDNKERLWDKNFFTQAEWQNKLSPLFSLKAQAKYTYSRSKYRDENQRYETGEQTDKHRQNEMYTSVALLAAFSRSLSASVSADVAVNTLKSDIPDALDPTRYTTWGAVAAKYTATYLTLTGNLLATYISESSDKSEVAADRHKLSPSLAMVLSPWRDVNLNFRFLYKSTYRNPTFNDLYYLRVGNRNLQPESADEYNLGITWSGALSFVKYCRITADAYRNNVKNKIVALPTTYVWKMINMGKVRIEGIDVTGAAEIPLTEKISLNLSGGYTFQKAVDVTDPTSKTYKNQIPYSPKHSYNGGILVATPLCNVAYTFIGVSRRYVLPQNTEANMVNGYTEHSLSAHKEFTYAGCNLRLQGELINFTDEQYDVIKYYPMPGRSFRLSLTINY
jgi:outer membrane cobalamin receptor